MLLLAPQGGQAMAVARFGPLGVMRLEEHDVAVEQPGMLADQAVAEAEQEQPQPGQPDHRQRHADVPQHLDQPAEPQEPEQPQGLGRLLEPVSSCAASIWYERNPKGSEARKSITKWRRK